ncbi:DUF5071 domain-containing protein [Mucilaginibacter limnophilus]|uniref:DUF5071 domain-containing protein n=1 Tax=Mucilaginibacter limnophilus TaxID=1932778 RepID=A0A3S2UPM2_9SPHI|nr:DUF5071 domain-containing protein [Mucilaginibacter limnophilus]RVU01299.1 DUF5071 domain-containing protein [Mucilaginibacter limnophilus]
MNIRNLIPKDKFDESGVEELKKLSFEQIKPIIPNLLEWMQDMNWPVARCIADILEPFAHRITYEILYILKSDDVMWKFWILCVLIKSTNDPLILKEIERLAKNPTREEIENDVDLVAISILNGEYE